MKDFAKSVIFFLGMVVGVVLWVLKTTIKAVGFVFGGGRQMVRLAKADRQKKAEAAAA